MNTITIDGKKLEYEVHPYADCYPYLKKHEIEELADSIINVGLQRRITFWRKGSKNYLIDGRNRLKAMISIDGFRIKEKLHIEWKDFKKHNDADDYIKASNDHRRHLSKIEIYEVMQLKRDAYLDLGIQNMIKGGLKKTKGGRVNSPKETMPHNTRKLLSQDFGISEGTIKNLEVIWKSKDYAVHKALYDGKITPDLGRKAIQYIDSREERERLLKLPIKKLRSIIKFKEKPQKKKPKSQPQETESTKLSIDTHIQAIEKAKEEIERTNQKQPQEQNTEDKKRERHSFKETMIKAQEKDITMVNDVGIIKLNGCRITFFILLEDGKTKEVSIRCTEEQGQGLLKDYILKKDSESITK